MATLILKAEMLRRFVHYDSDTGVFTWRPRSGKDAKRWNGRYAGKTTGKRNAKGHLQIRIMGVTYMAHRLAWLYVYGKMPRLQIYHINGIKDDNRICNLREVTPSMNGENLRRARRDNKLGLLGVHYHEKDRKYLAQIQVNGVKMCVGRFDTAIEAHSAYLTAKRDLHEGCTI